ncbi:MAG: hypothetical protein NTW14_09865 [bacterium]|nr:hypothetical protein [bacterium]
MNSSLHNRSILFFVIIVVSSICLRAPLQAQDSTTAAEAKHICEVFLRSRVALADRILLHYLGVKSGDSLTDPAADTLNQVLVRDLTLCALFDLRLPNVKPDTVGAAHLRRAVTYLDGVYAVGLNLRVKMRLRSDFNAKPFWEKEYQFARDKARPIAHRIAADVIRQCTGEPAITETRIAFSGQVDGVKELFSMTFDGFDLVRHTWEKNPVLSPAWSPNGKQIAFTSFGVYQADIFIYDLDAKSSRPFFSAPGVDQAPAWSPDGQWLAYSSSVDGNAEIYVCRTDGGVAKRLTYSWSIETSPCWSPSGHEIAYTSDQLGKPQVFIMDTDGANQRRLTMIGEYNDSPAWSPRGDLIAYVRRDTDGFQIYVTDPRGERHVKATTGPGYNMDPSWSPDGMRIAFTSDRTGIFQIYTMDIYGRGVEIATTGTMNCSNPTWSPVLENMGDIGINNTKEP